MHGVKIYVLIRCGALDFDCCDTNSSVVDFHGRNHCMRFSVGCSCARKASLLPWTDRHCESMEAPPSNDGDGGGSGMIPGWSGSGRQGHAYI